MEERGEPMRFQVKANTPDTMDDFLEFFEQRAFRDNPEWAGCYCLHPYHNDEEWETANPRENRIEAMVRLAQGRLSGYLGYLDGKAIAWIAIGKRKSYLRYTDLVNEEDQAKSIYSITCITIDPEFRNQGIATALLERVIADLRLHEVDILEAYPMDKPASNAHQHRGPISLYQHAGFKIVDQVGIFTRMRKQL
ncbi:MAG: N-acetyltransferase [Erysipelotrichales bacterium]|nr:MAG: N-acetyltransferase [Erysipelotrichales bacterium]